VEPVAAPRIKICCMQSVDEAWVAIRAGASALGFVAHMPSGPGIISEELIAEIVRRVPPPIATFLLTCRRDVDGIEAQQRQTGANTLQLCDRLEPGTHRKLRARLPGVAIVQVIHVVGEESRTEAVDLAPKVDAILLDTGNLRSEVRELGGTGRLHDWKISARIRAAVPVPVFLAGGLRPENVTDAVHAVRPFAVDVCSGLRPNGSLDEERLRAFCGAVAAA
jgi:phosphoribosylanthranilate isomerase